MRPHSGACGIESRNLVLVRLEATDSHLWPTGQGWEATASADVSLHSWRGVEDIEDSLRKVRRFRQHAIDDFSIICDTMGSKSHVVLCMLPERRSSNEPGRD